MSSQNNDFSEPNDSLDAELERELAEALGDMGADSFMDFDQPEARSALTGDQIRRGRVIAIQGGDIFIDLGGKDQGVMSTDQFAGQELPQVGSIVEFAVTGYNAAEGLLTLSREGAVMAATWDSLKPGVIVEGKVTGHNKGGLELNLNGIKAFMPISQVELGRIEEEDLRTFVNRKLRCEVVEVRRGEKSVVVSRRGILRKEEEEARERAFETLVEGDLVTGTVKTIMPYGAFVDIGGVDGLLHVGDMSHARVKDPKDVVSVGQKLEVKILRVDRDQRKVALGLKQVMPDPWADARNKWIVQSVITGRVSRLADFGAFVELEEGVEGLVPISEFSFERRIRHPSEMVNVGDVVRVKVLNVDPEAKRIALSLKQVGDDPWMGAMTRWPIDSVVSGIVRRVADFGAFVELTAGVEGLIHISELSHERVRSVGDVVKEGDPVRVKVISVDEDRRRISLSLKQVAEMPDYTGPEPAATEEPAQPAKKRKKALKGGLDHGSFSLFG